MSGPLTPEAITSDASDYVDFLAQHNSVKAGPMGVVGYCFSGKMALLTAFSRPDKIQRQLPSTPAALRRCAEQSSSRLGPSVTARLYFGHAINDKGMPPEAIERLNQALAAWGGKYESEVYEGAFHSWTVPDSPVYNQPQAERAFEKLKQLFAETIA